MQHRHIWPLNFKSSVRFILFSAHMPTFLISTGFEIHSFKKCVVWIQLFFKLPIERKTG